MIVGISSPGASYSCTGNHHHRVLHLPRVHTPTAGLHLKMEYILSDVECEVVYISIWNICSIKLSVTHCWRYQPALCTSFSIGPPRHCHHLQSMSRKGFTKYIKGLALGVSQTSNLTLRFWASWSFISVMHSSIPMCSLVQNQEHILSKGKTHLAERKRTMESNFSFLLNWAACPDSFVHMCTLSGSNYGLVGFNIK